MTLLSKILLVVVGVLLAYSIIKEIEKPQPVSTGIDYDSYKKRFNNLEQKCDSLRFLIETIETKTTNIKLQILRDETKIKNLDNHGIDSAFAELLRTTK